MRIDDNDSEAVFCMTVISYTSPGRLFKIFMVEIPASPDVDFFGVITTAFDGCLVNGIF